MLPWATRARSFHLRLRASAGSGLFGIVYRESRIDGPPSLGRHGTLVEHEVEHETITLLGLPCSSSRAPRALRP